MSITLFITGIAAPLLMLLSSLSVMSAGLVRDGFGWAAVAKVQKGKGGKAPCPRPRYRLM